MTSTRSVARNRGSPLTGLFSSRHENSGADRGGSHIDYKTLAKVHGVLQDAAVQMSARETPFKAAHEVAMLRVE